MKIYPNTLTELYIEWELEGEAFRISRSTSPASEFEVVADSAGAKVSEDGPQTLEYTIRDPIANKVLTESNVLLKQMRNPPVFFLLKRRVSMPCPNCWNPVTRRVRFPNCPVCGGTGKIGGYHLPIPARVSQDVSQLVVASDAFDSDKVNMTPIRAWTTNYPRVYPEDIMVDIMNQRFKIVSVARRTKSQYVIRQVLDLVPLQKGHPAYQVEVDRRKLPE